MISFAVACGGHQVGTADASREAAERDAQGEGSLAQDTEGSADPSKLQLLTQSCCLPYSSCNKPGSAMHLVASSQGRKGYAWGWACSVKMTQLKV